MPRRSRDKFGEYHGKHKYISANFQRDWEAKQDKVEVKTHVELEQGNTVEIETEIPETIEGAIADYTSEDIKKQRRERIKKAHPDRGGTDEELKKVLDEEG